MLLERAEAAGARFRHGVAVTGIDVRGGAVRAVRAGDEVLPADDVVVAAGIWGPEVAALAGVELPLVPVAHPYVHGPRHARAARSPDGPSPFVRWPEHHVYARDHGDRLGLGTYDHAPLPVPRPGADAERPWPVELFDPAVDRALTLLPAGRRFVPEQRLNGVFSMTPDNLPLLGAVPGVAGLWVAEALWVTHAAGAARALARSMAGAEPDVAGIDALRPDRFAGRPAAELVERSLRLYRDIYASA